jgi:hypothetical protein
LPGQRRGRVVEGLARTIDIVPTIARALRVRIPWRVDGNSLVGRRPPLNGTVSVELKEGRPVSASLAALRARRARALAKQISLFGTGPFSRVYRIGPRRSLLGRRVSALPVRSSAAMRVEIEDRELLNAVDPDSGFLPSYVEGTLSGRHGPRPQLAIAVNGRIEAVTRAFPQKGRTLFGAFVREEALVRGRNAVEVFALRGRALERLRGSEVVLTLRREGDREVIAGGLRRLRVVPGALTGTVRVTASGTRYEFSGRARNRRTRWRADTIAVFVDGRAVYSAGTGHVRPHHILGQRGTKDGFVFELPRALFPAPGSDHDVRVFATGGAFASELRYAGGYPWPRR